MCLPRSPEGRLLYAGQLLALTATNVALGRLALAMYPASSFASLAWPVWPATALSLVALVLGGYRLWPGVAVGAVLTDLLMGAPPLVAFGIGVGNTLEAVAGAFALRSLPGFRGSLDRFSEVLALVVLAGMGSTVVSATVGTASLRLGGLLSSADFARAWGVWWTSNFTADLTLAPVLLTWARGPRLDARPAALAEVAALAASLGVTAALVFGQRPEAAAQSPIFVPFLLFVPLVWAALRFGTRGAATAAFVVGAVAVWGTSTGHGAFARGSWSDSLLALHVFLAAASLPSLALGAVVGDRERSVNEVRAAEALLRAIMEGTLDAVFVKDRRGRYVIINPAGARLFGVTPEAVTGAEDSALFPAAEARRIHEQDESIVRTGRSWTSEDTITFAGRARVYHTVKAPYRGGAGEVLGIIGIARDITERKSEEAARAWLAAIVESSSNAVIGTTLEGIITSWNAAAARVYGYPAEEAIGRPFAMLVPPERQDELACLLDQVRRGDPVRDRETVRCRKDGTRLDVAVSLFPIRDASGAIIGISTIPRDLTESEELSRLAAEAGNLGMWFWNLKSDRLCWTPICRSIHGLGPHEEPSYARLLAMMHPDDRARVEGEVRRAIAERAAYRIEYRVVWSDGSVRWISVLGRPLYDEAGAPDRMVGVVLDITSRKRTEEELAALLSREQAALVEAQATARAKDDFLAVLSHELRTPLQSMLGWTQLLNKRVDDVDAVRRGLATIERNVRTQARLIEDLLDVSRIVAGKLRVEQRCVDLADVLAAAVECARSAAEASAIRLEVTIAPIAGVVLGDPDRLQQVVANLLTNAVKFTPSGGRIGVRLERARTTARIVVEDTGRGMSPEILPYVFDRFRQAETGTTRRQGGLGLGLAIVRHLVELHGGSVKAESAGEGQGATFTVTLPFVSAASAAVATERGPQSRGGAPRVLEGVRILVVDDDADARELLDLVLREAGAEVHAVPSVRVALGDLASFRPDVLLSDIGMPEEDGYALIREVRARESAGGVHIPAIALTAFASCTDRADALALGFEEHLAKPANAGDLARAVASLARRAA